MSKTISQKFFTVILISVFLLFTGQLYEAAASKEISSEHTSRFIYKLDSEETLILDGLEFNGRSLIHAFLDAAFTRDVVNDNPNLYGLTLLHSNSPVPNGKSSLFSSEFIYQAYPWLAPHIYPDDGLPRLLSINKWTKPVRISFGFPNDLAVMKTNGDQAADDYDGLFNNIDEKRALAEFSQRPDFPSIEHFVIENSRSLTDATGIQVSYIPHIQESLTDYANVRISIVDERGDNGGYKYSRIKTQISADGTGSKYIRLVEWTMLKNGFRFAASNEYQVDGYFASNKRNEIELAVCYIWQGHETALLKSLIHECIVRSMGLPGIIRKIPGQVSKPSSILTSWGNLQRSGAAGPNFSLPSTPRLSEFDSYLLKLLYNTELAPGTDFYNAQKILLK